MESVDRLSIAIMICTSKRREALFDCLNSVKKQTFLPNRVIVVEKVIDEQTIDKDKLASIFSDKVATSYKKISAGNISVSRNLALNLAREDILLFVDDDVLLEPKYIEKLLKIYKDNLDKNFVVGAIKVERDNYWQNFSLKLITACLEDGKKQQEVLHWPALNFSFRRTAIKKFNLYFDEKYSALEDISFCLKISELNQKIYYFPNLSVVHKFRSNFSSFSDSFRKYYKNIDYLYSDYPKQDIFNRNLYRKSILRPAKILISSYQMTRNFHLEGKYFFAFCVYHYLVSRSILSTHGIH